MPVKITHLQISYVQLRNLPAMEVLPKNFQRQIYFQFQSRKWKQIGKKA